MSACSARSGGDQEKPSTKSLTHEELAHIKTPRAAPGVANVDDEPSGCSSKRRKIRVDPIAR